MAEDLSMIIREMIVCMGEQRCSAKFNTGLDFKVSPLIDRCNTLCSVPKYCVGMSDTLREAETMIRQRFWSTLIFGFSAC